jgi:hypothetical protein
MPITGEKKKKSFLEFAGKWQGDDPDEMFAQLMKDRDQVHCRQVDF